MTSLASDFTVQVAHCYYHCMEYFEVTLIVFLSLQNYKQTRMWANAQRDGHPAEYRWRPLFNTTKFG